MSGRTRQNKINKVDPTARNKLTQRDGMADLVFLSLRDNKYLRGIQTPLVEVS